MVGNDAHPTRWGKENAGLAYLLAKMPRTVFVPAPIAENAGYVVLQSRHSGLWSDGDGAQRRELWNELVPPPLVRRVWPESGHVARARRGYCLAP